MIIVGEPAVAVNEPDKLVVIPTLGVIPVKLEPSPLYVVAVTTPEILTLSNSVWPSTSKIPVAVTLVAVKLPSIAKLLLLGL